MPFIQDLKTKQDLTSALYEMQVVNRKIEAFHLKCKKKPDDICVQTAYSTIDVILKSLTYVSTEFEAPDIENTYVETENIRFHRAKSVIDSGHSRYQRLPRYEVSSPRSHKSDRWHNYPRKSSQSSITDTCSQESRKSIRSKSREFEPRSSSYRSSNSRSNITPGYERISKSRTREMSKPKIREKCKSRSREKSRMRDSSYPRISRSNSRNRSNSRSVDQTYSPSRSMRRCERSRSRILQSRERSKMRESSYSRRSRSKSRYRSNSKSVDQTYSPSKRRSISRSKRSQSRILRSREKSIPSSRNHQHNTYLQKPNRRVDLDESFHLHLSESSDEETKSEKQRASTSTWDTQVTDFVSKIRRSTPHDQILRSRMSQPKLDLPSLKETGMTQNVAKDKLSDCFEMKPSRDPRIQAKKIQIVLNKLKDKKI